MDWSAVTFNDGTHLTEKPYSRLLHGAKLYLVLASEGKACRKPLRGTVLKSEWHRLTQLLRYMVARDLVSFQDLSIAHIIGYRNYVARRKKKITQTKLGKEHVSSNTQHKLLDVVKRLVRLQTEMSRWGTKLTNAEVGELLGYLRTPKGEARFTEIIPDEHFRQIMNSALDWLSNESKKLLMVEAAFDVYRKKRLLPGESERSRERYEDVADSLLPDDDIAFEGTRKTLKSLTYYDVGRLVTITRGACFVVIAGGVGMRESEIDSLQMGCMRSASFGNGPSILELEGTLYKTSSSADGEAASWHAGYDDARNPVRQAVLILESLPRPGFGTSLFGRMFDTGTRLGENSRLAKAGVRKALRGFAAHAGLSSLWNFSPHQFRKAFARFVALSGVSAIFALMRHFKHQSVLMTERYLPRLKTDPELLNEVFEAREHLIAGRLDNILAPNV